MRSIGPRWNDEQGCFGCVLNASARVDALRRRRRQLFVRHAIPKAIWDGVTVAESREAARRRRGSSPTGMAAPPILASFWGGVSVEQSRVEEA